MKKSEKAEVNDKPRYQASTRTKQNSGVGLATREKDGGNF